MADADTTADAETTVDAAHMAADTAATGPTPAGPVTAERRAPTAVEAPADMPAERVDIAAVGLAAQSVAADSTAVVAADSTAAVAADSTAAVVVTAVVVVTGNPTVRVT